MLWHGVCFTGLTVARPSVDSEQVKVQLGKTLYVDFTSADAATMRAKALELHRDLLAMGLRPAGA